MFFVSTTVSFGHFCSALHHDWQTSCIVSHSVDVRVWSCTSVHPGMFIKTLSALVLILVCSKHPLYLQHTSCPYLVDYIKILSIISCAIDDIFCSMRNRLLPSVHSDLILRNELTEQGGWRSLFCHWKSQAWLKIRALCSNCWFLLHLETQPVRRCPLSRDFKFSTRQIRH